MRWVDQAPKSRSEAMTVRPWERFEPEDIKRNQKMRKRLDYPDKQLLAECEVHTYRSSGPGGQKKNKTFSAVRIRHQPSDITVVGTESRSQHENRARALRRLRLEIAVKFRCLLPDKIEWPSRVHLAGGNLRVNPSNPEFPKVAALALDALMEMAGDLRKSSTVLGITSSSLSRLLTEDRKVWGEANRIRGLCGLRSLKKG